MRVGCESLMCTELLTYVVLRVSKQPGDFVVACFYHSQLGTVKLYYMIREAQQYVPLVIRYTTSSLIIDNVERVQDMYIFHCLLESKPFESSLCEP